MLNFLSDLLGSGLGNLAAYLAAHVLLCLLPAFYIAGAMTALIPKETITRYLGRSTPKYISYPAAGAAGFLLAVCSCTVIPLFAGIYKKGAGLGPAITFLFVAPAVNILALTYTGTVIGPDLAIARLVLSLAFGIGIGIIMALLFSKEDAAHDKATDKMFAGQASMRKAALIFLLVLVALLVTGTFQLEVLKATYLEFTLPFKGIGTFQDYLYQLVPFDAARGEEGVTAQGVLLIGMLVLIGLTSWRGIEHIHDGFNFWTWGSTALVGITLLIAALGMVPTADGLVIHLTGKFIGVLLSIVVLAWMLRTQLHEDEVRDFLWENLAFHQTDFPSAGGRCVCGGDDPGIDPTGNGSRPWQGKIPYWATLSVWCFGVFMYFPTLVEVPIARMFLDLGMHRGPLLGLFDL